MKPLFIPLMKEYYQAFERGDKEIEFRLYGKRWNWKTCQVGRDVILSCGYGKRNRLKGRISAFDKILLSELNETVINDMIKIYGDIDVEVACIHISDITPLND